MAPLVFFRAFGLFFFLAFGLLLLFAALFFFAIHPSFLLVVKGPITLWEVLYHI